MNNHNKYTFGAIPSPVDIRDYKLKNVVGAPSFPDEFELKMRPVKNQQHVNSCVGHAIATTIEYFNYIQEKSTSKMSTGFIYGNRRNSSHHGCGMIIRDALKAAVKYGDVKNSDFPYNIEVPSAINKFEESFNDLEEKAYPNRISTFYRVNSTNEIKSAIMNDGPVIFAINWYSDLETDSKGIMHSNRLDKDLCGGHCMVIYGWNKDGWKIQNSYGLSWGNTGRAILPYSYPLMEAWGITDTITESESIISTPFKSNIGQKIAKAINKLLNLFKKKPKNCI